MSGIARKLLALGALSAALASGCAPRAAHQAASADLAAADQAKEDDPARLPAALEALEPSVQQRRRLVALKAELATHLEPLEEAGRDLTLAIAATARRCDGTTMALDDAASWAVLVSDQGSDAVLDAIDELHRILTPAQRQALVERLLAREEESKSEESTDEGARSLGDALDLSFGQMLVVLARGQALKGELEERLKPWRKKLKRALRAFPADDFAIRDHEIARVPAVALATGFVRDAVRTLLPILEPAQCQALADFIEREVGKTDEQR
jgi:hypothetical protein